MLQKEERFTLKVGSLVYECLVEAVRGALVGPVVPLSQGDIRWGREIIGQSQETIKGVGCALTCAAMIVSQIDETITPSVLNRFLIKVYGFRGSYMRWGLVSKAYSLIKYHGPYDMRIDGPLLWRNTPADIPRVKRELARGPVIIEVNYRPGKVFRQHFVVGTMMTGGGDVFIIDPIDGQYTSLLSRYGLPDWTLERAIYGLRLLRVDNAG